MRSKAAAGVAASARPAPLARQTDHRLGQTAAMAATVSSSGTVRARRFAHNDRHHLQGAPEQRIDRGQRVADGAEMLPVTRMSGNCSAIITSRTVPLLIRAAP